MTLACRYHILLLLLPFTNWSWKAGKMEYPTQFSSFLSLCKSIKIFYKWRNHSCLLWISDSFPWGIHNVSSLTTQVSMYEKRQPQRKNEWLLHARAVNERCRGLKRWSYFSFLPGSILHQTLQKGICPQCSQERDSTTIPFIANKIIRKIGRTYLVPFYPSN